MPPTAKLRETKNAGTPSRDAGRDGVGGGAQDIIAGRRPLSDWDQLVKDWQNNGGNQVKQELAASYQQLMSG